MSTPQDYMNRLFAQAQAGAANPEVAQAGRAAGLGAVTGYGTESMGSELEVDARTMSAAQLAQKYGHETAMGLLGSKAVAAQQYQNLRDVNTRSGFEVIDDTVQGVADGFINSVLGIAGLATGAVSDAGGAAIAEAAEDYNEWSGGFRSDQMQSRSLARELRNEMRQRDNAAAYEIDKKADGDGLMTGLRRIGREALSGGAAMFDDGTTFGEDVSQAVGSLAAGGPISKGLKFAGQSLRGGAKLVAPKTAERVSNAVFAARGAGVPATRAQAIFNTALSKTGQVAPMMAAITAMEAGGAYNETVQDVMSMDFASLAQNSPVYNELIKQGMTPEDARMEIANVAGLTAAGKTAMIAAPLSTLVARFEGNVFSRRAITEARQNIGKPVGNILGESVEEGGIGLGSGLAQNDAIQQYADRTRNKTENVGERAGQGIVLGAAAAGVAQSVRAPSSVAGAALKTAGAVGSAIKGASSRLGTEAQAQVVSEQLGKTQESVTAAEASVAQASPEVRAKWDAAKAIYDVPKGAFQAEDVDPYIASVVGDVSNLPEAFSKLTAAVKEGKASPEQTESLEDMINFLSDDMESAVATAGLETTGDAAIDAAISSMAETMNVVRDDEVIAKAKANSISRAQKRIADAAASSEQKTAAAETLIKSDPMSIPVEEAKVQLQHAESSTSNMSPTSKAALQASLTMIEEDTARRKALQNDGYTPTNNDKVSDQVRTSTEWGNGTAQSLSGHIGRIFNFVAHGSKAAAAEQADHLSNFAQNMINKVEALNTHYKDWSNAEPVGYQQYTREGVWRTVESGKKAGLSVIPVSGNSLQNARAIESDAQMAVNTVNAMADAFPELGLKKLAMPYLDQGLQGSKEDVIARHKQATGPAPIKRGQESKTSESGGAKKAEPKKEQSPVEQLIDSASNKEQEAKDQMDAEKRARFEKEKAEARARKEKEAEAKKSQEEADAAAFQKELEAARAILEDKNAETPFDFAKTELASEEDMAQALSMTDAEYVAAVSSDNADSSSEVRDGLIAELKEAELPKKAKKIGTNEGIDLYAYGNFLYAVQGNKVVGQLAVTEGGTEFAVLPETQGKGIGKMLMRELLIRDPLHASGGMSPAAKATRLSVLKDLKAEQKPTAAQTTNMAEEVQTAVKEPTIAEVTTTTEVDPVEAHPMDASPNPETWGNDYNESETTPVGRTGLKEDKNLAARFKRFMKGSWFNYIFQSKTEESRIAGNSITQLAELFLHPELSKEIPAVGEVSEDTLMAYRDLVSAAGNEIVEILHERMGEFLAQKYSKKDPRPRREVMKTSEMFFHLDSGRMTHLLEETPAGLQLNEEAVTAAALAGLQWFLNSGTGNPMNSEEWEQALGMTVSDAEVNKLNQGTNYEDAVSEIAQRIERYLDIRTSEDAPTGMTQGITNQLAQEVLEAMNYGSVAFTSVTEVRVSGSENTNDLSQSSEEDTDIITIRRLVTHKEGMPETLKSDSNVIERIFAKEPAAGKFYFGDKTPKAHVTRHNQPRVLNTPEQVAVLETMIQQTYGLNMPMLRMLQSMDDNTATIMFAEGILDPDKHNKHDFESKKSRNNNVTNALKTMREMVSEMTNSLSDGQTLDQVAIRYDWNFTSVTRAMMLGDSNPQANKVMRALVLPTWSTVDTTSDSGSTAWTLAMGQGLGIKIHTQPLEATETQLRELLEGPLKEALVTLRAWDKSKDGKIDLATAKKLREQMKAAGVTDPAWGLFVLMEQARLENASPAERKSFTTPLYLEADGVTNGPIMGIGMLTTKWTPRSLHNLQKGGIAVGRKDMTLSDMRAEDSVDLYGESGKGFPEKFKENIEGQAKDITEAANNLLKLMSNFLGPKFLTYTVDDNGNTAIKVDRGLAKSPLTITLYGAGAAGIAGNFVDEIMEIFHERISEVMAKLPAEASPEEEAAAMNEVFNEEAQTLLDFFSDNYVGYSSESKKFYISKNANGSKFPGRKGKAYSKKDQDGGKTLKNLTFSRVTYENMKSAILNLFVKPLIESINDTVGHDVMGGMKAIQKITSTQSVLAVQMFQDELTAMLDSKKAADPSFRVADFLSNRELDQLFAKMSKTFPVIEINGHTFDLMGRMKSFLKKVNVSDLLVGNRVMPAKSYGPKTLGVGGIPSMIIGSGDASMILGAYLTGQMEDTMSVYDGVHLSLANIQKQSEILNEQAFRAAMSNPVDAVVKSLEATLKNINLEELLGSLIDTYLVEVKGSPSEATFGSTPIGQLVRTLEVDSETVMSMLAAGKRANLIKGFVTTIQKALAAANLQGEKIEASHQAVGSIGAVVDHMASGFSPKNIDANQEGNFDGMSYEALADELEGRTLTLLLNGSPDAQAYAQNQSLGRKSVEVQNLPALAPTPVGNTTKSGAVVMSFEHLLERSRASELTPVQREMLREALRSGSLRDWTFVTGTPEQLSAYSAAATEALSPEANSTVHGAVDLGTKTVFLPATENETLIHETVHAATIQNLLNALTGKKVPSHVKQAAENLEALLEDFMAIRVEQMPAAAQVSYVDAKSEAMKYLSQNTPVGKALAINEMMAWVLGNKSLSDALKQKQAPSKVVEFTKRLINAVKRMFWGSATVSVPANDFLSNLMFNTKVLMNTVPDNTGTDGDQQGGNTTLKHQTSRRSTLNEMADNLENRLRAFIAEGIDVANLGITPNSQQMQAAKAASQKLVELDFAGFKMTPDERRTANVLMTVLGTSMSVDPNVMNTAQRVYDTAMKTLTPDTFREVGVDKDQASEMYDAVSGKQSQGRDALGRSLLLPSFLALAFTNPVMQQVLSNISTPTRTKKGNESFDQMLERLGGMSMDFLDRKLSGQTGKEQNLQQVMDRLFSHVHLAAMNNENWFTSASKAGQSWADKGNDLVLKGFEAADSKLKSTIAGLSNSNTRMDKNIKNALTLLRGGLTDSGADRVAQGATSLINQKGVLQWVRDLSNDLIGRTDANASLYDMIKVVRTKVQQMRQLYREDVPVLFHKKFSSAPTAEQYAAMKKALGDTEIASLLGSMDLEEVLEVIKDGKKLKAKLAALKSKMTSNAVLFKANQLADYMVTGDPGVGLQKNAYAIAVLTGKDGSPDNVNNIDAYVSLLALSKTDPEVLKEVQTLLIHDSKAVGFMLSYNKEQLVIDTARAEQSEVARLNRYKGQLPASLVPGQRLVVRPISEHGKLMSLGYTKVADYIGSSAERVKEPRAYYFSPVDGQAVFNQGLLQNTQQSVGGVQMSTGFSMNSTIAGRITDKKAVDRITNDITFNGDKGRETLMPIYDAEHKVVAYERSIRQDMKDRVIAEHHYGKALGMWRGRQVEELVGDTFNRNLVRDLKSRQDRAKPGELASQFIDLRSDEAYKDPILRDALLLLTKDVEEMLNEEFGEDQPIYIERSMVKDVLGYRAATVGDMWTGTTRLSPAATEMVKDLLTTVLGKDAYTMAVKGERFVQGMVTDARVLIAVKSVVVPAVNMLANLLHLISRGVPLHTIKRMPEKLNELNQYVKMESERIAAETELTATKSGTLEHRRLTNRLQAIQDAQHRLSIWPLIEAGEFSTVSEVGLTHEDLMLTRGRLSDYIEKQIDKLPSEVATVGHNLLLSKHTALFRGLQKSVQYGDFLAKAVLYDHLLTQKGQTKQKALSIITEEFVNYDRLPGRTRGYLESVGLMWFYNFKLRTVKVAFSTIRNNPLHTLLAFMIPEPDIFGNAGLPVEDNALTKLMGGSLWGSLGPAQGMRAIGLNPWFNAIN